MPELLDVNRLAVFTHLILCPIPSPFVTSFLLQLLSQSTDKTAWTPSLLQHLREEPERDHVLYSFPPDGCAPLFPKHDDTAEERVAFSGILWHICNNNKIFWRLFMTSEDSWLGTTHIHRVKFLVSKSRVPVISLLEATFATWNPHRRSGCVWEEPCLVRLHCGQEKADNKEVQAVRG